MPDILNNNLLSLLIFLPLAGALVILLMKRPADDPEEHGHHGDAHAHDLRGHAGTTPDGQAEVEGDTPKALTGGRKGGSADGIRWFTLIWTGVVFALSLLLLFRYEPNRAGFQFVEGPALWIRQFKVHYHLGVDGISILLIVLATFLTFLAAVFSMSVGKRVKEYMVFLLVLETAMIGVFSALDLVLFYIFWEAVLIPMYFLIGIWGHERRIYAAVKFFLYTFAGSVLMLVGIIYLYIHTGTFSLTQLVTPGGEPFRLLMGMDPRALMWVYLSFALAFMIKVPMFPFHTWLPDAHVEAPTAGSVILAGVMLKMGTYGFLRFCLPLFPQQAQASAPYFIALAVIGIIYGAAVAAVQPDMKKLVAYSSVSHLGFVMLGVFSFTELGITGAVLQSINHGISTGMLFFMIGMLYERRHTREIAAYGGIKRAVPVYSAFFLIALLSSVALPLTNGFVGEFTILQGSFISNTAGPVWTGLAATGMVLSAVYMLWMFQRVFTGPIDKPVNAHLKDLTGREQLVLAPLVVLIFWFGCYVAPWTRFLTTPVRALAQPDADRRFMMESASANAPANTPAVEPVRGIND
jgi:NADH-quinone oxidoreductase subunit M